MPDDRAIVAAVVIGRNEGERLKRCLRSVQPEVDRTVYVDSGSSDGSVEHARAVGATVVELDTTVGFTAARARNAGVEALRLGGEPPDFVQFVDGDCELRPGWIEAGRSFLEAHPDVAVVCGRRRERFPDASIWNAMIDAEWDTPVGETRACGGDALMRWQPLEAVGGFDPTLIAGEEPELCVRLRFAGWKIWRLDGEMTLHDAAMTRFSQWWRRSRRAGHAYAEGYTMHGAPPERHKAGELRRALLWGVALPAATAIGVAVLGPSMLVLLLAYPMQALRLLFSGKGVARSVFLTLGKFPEALGAADFFLTRLRGQRRGLIEYKT